MLTPGDTIIPLNSKLRLPSDHLEVCMLLNQQANKAISLLAGVTGVDYQGNIGLLLHNGQNKEYSRIQEIP